MSECQGSHTWEDSPWVPPGHSTYAVAESLRQLLAWLTGTVRNAKEILREVPALGPIKVLC